MPTAAALRAQIEAALADRIPSALTPAPKIIRLVAPTGIPSIDELLSGGLPLGAITELAGAECSGRTALALSFIAHLTQEAKVCAWIDVSDALHPESAAASGVDLKRLLWVRCGITASGRIQHAPERALALLPEKKYLIPPPVKKGLHGGGFGPHPRGEIKGLSHAVDHLLQPGRMAPQRHARTERAVISPGALQPARNTGKSSGKPWSRLDQALRVADLLLQGGGFSAIVLDMGSIAPEFASRVPLATWFRYRAAAESSQACILLLTQHACAKSSASLALRLHSDSAIQEETTVFTGIEHRIEVARERFTPTPTNVIPLRKPPQAERSVSWHSRTTWAGRR